MAVNPAFLGPWKEALRPKAKQLIKPLSEIYSDDTQDELARSLATSLLADYASQDVKQLVSLVSIANEKQFAMLYPVLSQHDSAAVKELRSILQRKVEPTWNDSALDPAWQPVPTPVMLGIESAQGVLDERFAFCQTMPLNQCVEVNESLRQSGYRPLRFRPYAIDRGVQVAAVWTRDSRAWQMVHDLSAEQIQAKDKEFRQKGLIPVDVSGYIGRDEAGQSASRFAAVWVDSAEEGSEVRMYVGVPVGFEQSQHNEPLSAAGFNTLTLHAFVGQDGVEYRSAIWLRREGEEESTSKVFEGIEPHFNGEIYPGLLITDLNFTRNAELHDSQVLYSEKLKSLEAMLTEPVHIADVRKSIAKVRFQLKQDEQALEDLNWLIERQPDDSELYQLRAIIHARAKQADEAKRDLATFAELNQDSGLNGYLYAVVSVHLGEDAEAMQWLQAAITDAPDDLDVLYNAARAYSVASAVLETEKLAKSKVYADRAVALLQELLATGRGYIDWVWQDADFAPLRKHPEFEQLWLESSCAAVWNESTAFESTELHGQGPGELLRHCSELLKTGYRPTTVSVSTTNDNFSLATASVWHRPLVSDAAKESLAKQQANTAVALFRMGQSQDVWPLLKHSADPRRRSYLVHRLGQNGATAQAIVERLNIESDVSIRRALILVLGEFDERKLPTADQAKLKEMLLELYATDPDAGIHAASEWVLRRWNADVQLKELTHALATGQPDGKRKWYVNKQGQTLAIIAGPTEFLMGSPSSEEGRSPHIETQRHERIDRSFAIMTHEVTIDQFSKAMGIEEQCNDAQGIQLFRAISNDDAAVSNMSWYLAAAYCNWLSKQEGIPEDEWCYLPNDDMRYSEGMKYASGYLDRRGYRLPTTKEWEYACRAGAFTARYFGETEELLGEYAWYAKNSPSGQESEVGHLKPNDMGLFDMLGNMREWCSDASVTVPIDKYFRQAGYPGQFRIMRGGSFNDHPTGLRSAAEDPVIPASYVTHGFGMRAARTHP